MKEKFSNVAIDLITNEDVNAGKTNGCRYSDNMSLQFLFITIHLSKKETETEKRGNDNKIILSYL